MLDGVMNAGKLGAYVFMDHQHVQSVAS